MERLWASTWVYVGHDSQVPAPGDYFTTDIAGKPVIMVRHEDGSVRVLMNRCAHKGARVVSAVHGNTGKFFRCPYHAWAYNTDGSIRAIPLKGGYDGTRMSECETGRGMVAVRNVEIYRGFVFARLSGRGPGFREYFGEPLSSIVARIGELISYQSYNTKSPLNGEAARWVNDHVDELPLDPVSMILDEAGPVPAARAAAVPPPEPSPAPPPSPRAVDVEAVGFVACTQCGSKLRLNPALAGKKVRCPKCQSIMTFPSA